MTNREPITNRARTAWAVPSTLVHLAIGAVIAAALLGPAYDRQSLVIVLAATAFPDLDTFVGIWWTGAHRTLFHTAAVPLFLGVLVVADARRGDRSWLRRRLGAAGVRTAAVAVLAVALAGIAPDFVTNGVNLLYPVEDQFIRFTGDVTFSTQDGFVQTFVSLADPSSATVGSSGEVHYSTGVDPVSGPEPKNVERVFLIVNSGIELLLVVLGVLVTAVRLRDEA